MRRTLAALAAAALLSVPMVGAPSEAHAQNVVIPDGLVNVQIVGVRIIRDVQVGAIVDVVANVCPNVNVDLVALASQVDTSGKRQTVNCDADSQPELVITNNR